jgi:hypothetical protein
MVQTRDYISTKDQLGRPDQTGLFVKKIPEKVKIDDKPLIVLKNTTNPQNTWGNTTWNGGYWASSNIISANLIQRVVNRNNTFNELFVNDDLKVSSTGSWDTTNQQLVLADGEEAVGYYFMNVQNITNSKIIVTGETDNALLYLSSDDGDNFESVSNNVQHGFTNVGQKGQWKIVASGGTVTATKIIIEYNK